MVHQEREDSMAETVPRVSVQALRVFFTQHIEAALKKPHTRLDGEVERRRRQGRPATLMTTVPVTNDPVVEEPKSKTDAASRMAKSASMGDLNRLLAKLRPVPKPRTVFVTSKRPADSTKTLSEDSQDKSEEPLLRKFERSTGPRIPRFSYHAGLDGADVNGKSNSTSTQPGDPHTADSCGQENTPTPSPVNITLKPLPKKGDCVPASSETLHYQNGPTWSMPKHLASMVTSDNYVSKAKLRYRKKEIPSKEEAGPPPAKPAKPPYVTLVTSRNHRYFPFLFRQQNALASSRPLSTSAPVLTSRPSRIPPVPPTVPPSASLRPFRPLPLPPGLSCRSASPRLLNGLSAARRRSSYDRFTKDEDTCEPLIPEYTEEEELGDSRLSLQDSSLPGDDFYYCVPPTLPPPLRPKNQLSGRRTCQSTSNIAPSDELYQDATSANSEGVYEVVPGDASEEEQPYANRRSFGRQREVAVSIRKKLQIFHREEQKRIKKEREKREKDFDKLRKKFGMTGAEVPLDMGLVKNDSRGGRLDLAVKKGEPVLILRMENNPSGRWLVKNERGKIGYVELTNIEMDADSIKSVMALRTTERRTEENDPFIDEEGIYEETFY